MSLNFKCFTFNFELHSKKTDEFGRGVMYPPCFSVFYCGITYHVSPLCSVGYRKPTAFLFVVVAVHTLTLSSLKQKSNKRERERESESIQGRKKKKLWQVILVSRRVDLLHQDRAHTEHTSTHHAQADIQEPVKKRVERSSRYDIRC
jgi:hypothetical protein